jgi:hypothetical protein
MTKRRDPGDRRWKKEDFDYNIFLRMLLLCISPNIYIYSILVHKPLFFNLILITRKKKQFIYGFIRLIRFDSFLITVKNT